MLPSSVVDPVLPALRVVTDLVLDDAFAHRDAIEGAINWGALRCVSAERYEADDGSSGVRVYIEEAAPDSYALVEFVRDGLATLGHPGVDVVCSW